DLRDPGRPFRQVGARLVDRAEHLVEDVDAGLARLIEGLGEHLSREAGDLDVHLDRRDALARPADLEVHVAEVVLVAEDVAQDGRPRLGIGEGAIADEATGDLIGTPASIRASVPPQTLAIEELPFDSKISLTTRIV